MLAPAERFDKQTETSKTPSSMPSTRSASMASQARYRPGHPGPRPPERTAGTSAGARTISSMPCWTDGPGPPRASSRGLRNGTRRAASRRSGAPTMTGRPTRTTAELLTKTLQIMLLQCENRQIRLLPAWPSDWGRDVQASRALRHQPWKGTPRQGKIERLNVSPKTRSADIVR